MELQRPKKWDMLSLAFWSYSPHTLRHLPQPTPKDVPAELDSSIFTFEDAFEDLLVLSQGQPLPDIEMKHDQRALLRRMFPGGEPPDFWFQRLRSQGLVGDAITLPSLTLRLPGWMTGEFDREPQESLPESARPHADTSGEAPEKHPWDRLMDDLGLSSGHSPNRDGPESRPGADTQKRQQPDHFDDLFSALESAVTEGQNSWNTFVKSLTEAKGPASDQQAKGPEEPSGTREVVKREEHVDRFGYVHSKVTIQTLDGDGNQIGSETHYTMRPANKGPAELEQDAEQSTDGDENRPNKRIGWFWK